MDSSREPEPNAHFIYSLICDYWMMPELLLLKDSPVVGQLNRHLDEGVWTQLKLFDKLFSKALEVKTFDVQIVDETEGRI